VLFRAVSKKAENVSRIRFSANSCEQKTKEVPSERDFLLTKAEGCFANSQRLSANRIPLKFAFPGGFEGCSDQKSTYLRHFSALIACDTYMIPT